MQSITSEVWEQGWDVSDDQSDPPCLFSQSLSPQCLPAVQGSHGSGTLTFQGIQGDLSGYKGRLLLTGKLTVDG